jgi:hypothetical protein
MDHHYGAVRPPSILPPTPDKDVSLVLILL